MKKKQCGNKYRLELTNLEKVLVLTCSKLNRPIRKNQLIKLIAQIFECNTPKQVEFAILDLIEQNKLYQHEYFICTAEYALTWNGQVTAADEAIIKFLTSKALREEIMLDTCFEILGDRLTVYMYFRYVEMVYPALLSDTNALTQMEQMDKHFSYGLKNHFYAEMNDYPVNRFLTKFFDNPDCRIFIKALDINRNHVNFHLVLLPGKRRSYKEAHEQYKAFKENICSYFDKDIHLHFKTTPLTMIIGSAKRRKKKY